MITVSSTETNAVALHNSSSRPHLLPCTVLYSPNITGTVTFLHLYTSHHSTLPPSHVPTLTSHTHTHTTPKGPSNLQEARLLLIGGQSLQVESKQCPLQVADGHVTVVATWITAHTSHSLGEENRSRGAEKLTLPPQTHNKPHHMSAPVPQICRHTNTHTDTTQSFLSLSSPRLQ